MIADVELKRSGFKSVFGQNSESSPKASRPQVWTPNVTTRMQATFIANPAFTCTGKLQVSTGKHGHAHGKVGKHG